MAYSYEEILRRSKEDPAAFLAECDGAYERRIDAAAEQIIAGMHESPIVLLSGPSGSGKTTTALKLEQALERRGVNTHAVSLDNYIRPLLPEEAPRTPEGDVDYESPLTLDMDLLADTFTRLSRGEEAFIPKFDFARQRRSDIRRPLRLGESEIAIFEGIHALNDDIAGRCPRAATLYISARSDIRDEGGVVFKGTWMRLARRAVRDVNFRGTDLARTLCMWHNVRRGEKKYISPFKQRAKIIIDSSLRYEVPVFANYAARLASALSGVPESNPRRRELEALTAAFDRFVPIDEALVARDSLIREFIGGGSYKYH